MVADLPISEDYQRIAIQGEPIFDTVKTLVVLSQQDYDEMAKAKHNVEYMKEIDRRVERLARGEGVHKTMEELRAMEDE